MVSQGECEFDDERIINNQVSLEEISNLENRLCYMFFERAKREGKQVEIIRSRDHYDLLRKQGKLFDDKLFMLFVDSSTEMVDFTSIRCKLLDTQEGLFYAKIISQREYLLTEAQP